MAIVARGLGLPDDGSLVAAGLGTSEVDANAMAATLSGSSSLTATLSAAEVTPTTTGGGGPLRRRYPEPTYTGPVLRRRNISARLTGSSSMTAELTFTVNFDADLELLLLLEVV